MRVAHITIEDVTSGLFRTQIVDVARQIVRHDPSITIDIHAINRPWKMMEHRSRLASYQKSLAGTGVRIVYTPVLPPLRDALGSASYSRAVTGVLTAALAARLDRRLDVFHSRSYWPAMALHTLGRRNIVLDPRSLWVSENLSTGDLAPGSASHRYWLRAEEQCVRDAAVTTAVSAGMIEYYAEEYGVTNVSLIPISFEPRVFRYSSEGRARGRAQLGWAGETVFVYSGSLGMSGVNVTALRQMFGLALADADARLLFLTAEPESSIQSVLQGTGADESRIRVIRPRQDEMGDWLSTADIGLHALPRQHDWRTRLGTKVVEYWACGLPVIVNENVGAAADYVRAEDVGRVIDDATTIQDFTRLVRESRGLDKQRVASFARRTFAAEVIAGLYRDAYVQAARGRD
jgi:glycosyltransferase involved in cell wall biosynthesis